MAAKTVLFQGAAGEVTDALMVERLKAVGAAECDVLYMHTDMTFGLPAKGLRRRELLGALLGVIESLGVRTLVFPTFTFSFCNGEAYDVLNSKTPMGALNEYARQTGRGVRSLDPLLSVYVLGDPLNLVDNLSAYSIGPGSTYDRLHECGREARFLFFGADMRACFTYTHYMEAMAHSPYRYDREFTGAVIDENGVRREGMKAILYSTYANCRLNTVPVVYNAMKTKGRLREAAVGDGGFCCLREKDAHAAISELLAADPLCLTDGTYDDAVRDTSYDARERVVSVK